MHDSSFSKSVKTQSAKIAGLLLLLVVLLIRRILSTLFTSPSVSLLVLQQEFFCPALRSLSNSLYYFFSIIRFLIQLLEPEVISKLKVSYEKAFSLKG